MSNIFQGKVGEISVQGLLEQGIVFKIPSYQRGYRWQTKQVQALVDDFSARWANAEKGDYLLQPIVVQGHDNSWLVVDGQQRLTTLKILLEVLVEKKLLGDEKSIWVIEAADKAAVQEKLTQACKDNARKVIQRVDSNRLSLIRNHLDDIKLIYYVLQEGDEEEANLAFERLNAGKISLTDSELIRALYLNDENNLGFEIAAEWEQISMALNDDSFWYMFNRKDVDHDSRMDRIFRIVTGQEENDVRGSAFLEIDSSLKKKETKESWWNKVLNLYWMLCQCYADLKLYHYIGWIAHSTSVRFENIYHLYEANRPNFCRNLQRYILGGAKDMIVDEKDANVKLPFIRAHHLSLVSEKHDFRKDKEFRYLYRPAEGDGIPKCFSSENDGVISNDVNTKQRDIVAFLLMFNLELLNQQGKNITRFPFQYFKKQVWNLEHVASHNPDAEIGEDKDCILQSDKNKIQNLVLLDENINKAYKDKPFNEKRLYILGLEKVQDGNGKMVEPFMPQGTVDVFSKSYTRNPSHFNSFSPEDMKSYSQKMIKVFSDMWDEAFGEKEG